MSEMGTTIRRRRISTEGDLEPPTSGFREYLLFALKTRLAPELQELIGRSVLVSYTGYPAPTMHLSLPGGSREPHINDQLRQELTALLEREAALPSHKRLQCLLLRWNSLRYLSVSNTSPERVSSRWLRSILPFIPVDETLFEDVEIPRVEYRNGGLYCDCLHTAGIVGVDEGEPYTQLYGRMSVRVVELIRQWYREGRLVDPDQVMVKKWKLVAVRTIGGSTLYKTADDWGLTGGTLLDMPISALLYELAKGRERSIAVRVGINLVDYHAISKKLFGGGLGSNKYHFSAGVLHAVPRDLDDLLRIVRGVDDVLYGGETSGAVVTLSATRPSWIRIYTLIVQRSITDDVVVYVRRDVEPAFIFSFTVPLDSNIAALRQEVVLRARRTMVYLLDRFAKPGYSEPVDIHSILDDPETQLPTDLSSPTVRSYLAKERGHPALDLQF